METQELLEWRMSHDAYEQLNAVHNWCGWQNYNYIDSDHIHSIADLVRLYEFCVYVVGVETPESVYELLEEEEGDGDTETKELCEQFNAEIGYDYWTL